MGRRERILRAMRFHYPDRVPVTHSFRPAALIKYGQRLLNIYRRYPSDFGQTYDEYDLTARQWQPEEPYHREYTDEWGSVIREEKKGLAGYVARPALANWDDYVNYKFPPAPPLEGAEFEKQLSLQRRLKAETVSWGGCASLMHTLVNLRGYEAVLVDIANEDERLLDLMDRLTDFMIAGVRQSAACACDVMGFADDWGSQEALLIHPKSWRKLFKPRYARVIQAIHEARAIAHMHSDGYIMEIIPDLIEIGLDGLNPQFSCHSLPELARAVKGKLYILSDTDRQHVLPFGSPQEVRSYVKMTIELFASPAGGFMGSGEIHDDVPLENAEAMYQAFRDFGVLNPDYLGEG